MIALHQTRKNASESTLKARDVDGDAIKTLGYADEDKRLRRSARSCLEENLTRPEPEEIWDRGEAIARLTVMGCTREQIQERLGVSRSWLSRALRKPALKERVQILAGAADGSALDVISEVKAMLPDAVGVLQGILEDGDNEKADQRLRFSAAQYALGLAGHVPPRNVNTNSVVTHLTPEMVRELRERAVSTGRVDLEARMEGPA